jgi:hypothetical protein
MYWGKDIPDDLQAVFDNLGLKEDKRRLYGLELEEIRRRQSGKQTRKAEDEQVLTSFLKWTEGANIAKLDIPTLKQKIEDLNNKVQDPEINAVGGKLKPVLDGKLPSRADGEDGDDGKDDFL